MLSTGHAKAQKKISGSTRTSNPVAILSCKELNDPMTSSPTPSQSLARGPKWVTQPPSPQPSRRPAGGREETRDTTGSLPKHNERTAKEEEGRKDEQQTETVEMEDGESTGNGEAAEVDELTEDDITIKEEEDSEQDIVSSIKMNNNTQQSTLKTPKSSDSTYIPFNRPQSTPSADVHPTPIPAVETVSTATAPCTIPRDPLSITCLTNVHANKERKIKPMTALSDPTRTGKLAGSVQPNSIAPKDQDSDNPIPAPTAVSDADSLTSSSRSKGQNRIPLPLASSTETLSLPNPRATRPLLVVVEIPTFRQVRKATYKLFYPKSPASPCFIDHGVAAATSEIEVPESENFDIVPGNCLLPMIGNDSSRKRKREKNEEGAIDKATRKRRTVERIAKTEDRGQSIDAHEMLRRARAEIFNPSWLEGKSASSNGEKRVRAETLSRCHLFASAYKVLLKSSPNKILRKYAIFVRPEELGKKCKKDGKRVIKIIESSGGTVGKSCRDLSESGKAKIICITPFDDSSCVIKVEDGCLRSRSMDMLEFLRWYDVKYTKCPTIREENPKMSQNSSKSLDSGRNCAQESIAEKTQMPPPISAKHPHGTTAPQLKQAKSHRKSKGQQSSTNAARAQITVEAVSPSSGLLERAQPSAGVDGRWGREHVGRYIGSLFKNATGDMITKKWFDQYRTKLLRNYSAKQGVVRASAKQSNDEMYESYRKKCFTKAFSELIKWTGETDVLRDHAVWDLNAKQLLKLKRNSDICGIVNNAGGETENSSKMVTKPIWIHLISRKDATEKPRDNPDGRTVRQYTDLQFYKYLYRLYKRSPAMPDEIFMHLP
ncbi:uncharacterized protein I303_106634 [Kwoniella dejecticola CBS 10117]|uniref:Uncharacterized protein n=1 Tax=Kwoniella dejecticola CBS 10117 TaxID=1296121 RepID=A0A1A5ZU46_9TREE|nr:uncharacterized protein I303_08723 [Kwoniella dejecticola CBS 10117]OBR81336.1 hypothetical protein I303_08723 [Kwoniella dejecticola CBS 10117]